MTDTPRTDAHYKSHPKDMFDHIQLEFARQLERELAEAKAELERCIRNREHGSECFFKEKERADSLQSKLNAIHAPESDVWLWQGDGSDHPESMVKSLPVVMTASTLREKQAEVRSLREQLTAHKAALEKCEKALFATWADLDHLNHWMSAPCRELYMEAKLEIAKLKGPK